MSGGQKQRLGLMLGLMKKSHIYLIDEGFSGIDPKMSDRILKNLFEKIKGTIVIVTHRLTDSIMTKFDKIIVMEDGKVAGIGTHYELMNNSTYRTLHDFISELPDGYDTIISDGGKELSGGQKCRISLARAFYRATPIILLDEVFASLDNNTTSFVKNSIEDLCNNNCCVLMITHRQDWINSQAQVIQIIRGG